MQENSQHYPGVNPNWNIFIQNWCSWFIHMQTCNVPDTLQHYLLSCSKYKQQSEKHSWPPMQPISKIHILRTWGQRHHICNITLSNIYTLCRILCYLNRDRDTLRAELTTLSKFSRGAEHIRWQIQCPPSKNWEGRSWNAQLITSKEEFERGDGAHKRIESTNEY